MSERKATCHPEKRYHAKGLCYRCYLRAWGKAHPGYGVKYRRRYVRSDEAHERWKTQKREKYYQAEYGISTAERDAMIEKQGGRCAICYRCPKQTAASWRRKVLHVDHDHEFGYVRGMLCNDCNNALGLFRDNLDVIHNAGRYLVMAKGKHWGIRLADPA